MVRNSEGINDIFVYPPLVLTSFLTGLPAFNHEWQEVYSDFIFV